MVVLFLFLVIGLTTALFLSRSNQDLRKSASEENCIVWPSENQGPASADTLQQLVYTNNCVMIRAGVWNIDKPITLLSNHTIKGAGRETTALVASGSWPNNGNEAVLQTIAQDTTGVTITGITLDANHKASYATCCRGITVENSVLKNARCNGVGVVGNNMVIRNNLIDNNGKDCQNAPPGAGIYSQPTSETDPPANWAPVIENNTIQNNGGPALDVNKVIGGKFTNNHVLNNASWAGVSIFGSSNWEISENTIIQPASDVAHPYHPECRSGSDGAHSAGIILCQENDTNNAATVNNRIYNNRVSSWYGILLIGNDEEKPYFAPRNNEVIGNDVSGSHNGCADDFKEGQWFDDKNKWERNNCNGSFDSNQAPLNF